MKETTLGDLQESVRDRSGFGNLDDYFKLCQTFILLLQKIQPTRIISPTHENYIFYQYNEDYAQKMVTLKS